MAGVGSGGPLGYGRKGIEGRSFGRLPDASGGRSGAAWSDITTGVGQAGVAMPRFPELRGKGNAGSDFPNLILPQGQEQGATPAIALRPSNVSTTRRRWAGGTGGIVTWFRASSL